MTPELLPTPFGYLSDGLPLAQAVDVTRSVAYFHGADITRPTLIVLLWAAIAAATVAVAARWQPRTRAAAAQPSRIPERAPVPADPRLSLGS